VNSVPMMLALALYATSTVLFMVWLMGLKAGALRLARPVLLAAAAAHLWAIGWHHVNHLPPAITATSGLFNLGVFVLVAGYLVLSMFASLPAAGALVAPLGTVMLATLINHGVRIEQGAVPPMEFIRFVTPVHIACSAIGFVCFGVGFASAVLLLVADQRLRERRPGAWPRLPPISRLETVSTLAVRLGFPFYTMGLVLGAVWAYWGSPEGVLVPEYALGGAVWALYAVLVYLFITTGWQGRRAAVLTMLGFLATIPIVLMYGLRRWG